MLSRRLGALALAASMRVFAQQAPTLTPLAAFPLRMDGPVLTQPVQTGEPFTVAGPRGVLVGQQQGEFEAWILPVKLLSHMTIEANVEGYPVPIDLNAMAREIEVRPDRTTITYAHIALTVRQTMFAADAMDAGTGAVVLFTVDALHPVELTFRFTAELRKMWPALSSGQPAAEWVPQGASGLYVLHSDFPDFAGAVALPGATSGIMAPYQERPQTHPLEFHLHVDPKTDRGKVFPLLMAVGSTRETASPAALRAKLAALDEHLAAIYAGHSARYAAQEKSLTRVVTPDARLNAAFGWAETSIGQLRARTAEGELGLVAGYYASGDSARPGFGWFFGRDALYTLFAVDSYGDFALTRHELEFLLKRQRADGKMMHEYSQTADQVDWKALPYEYAAADATPLFLLAMWDYVRASGDVAFVQEHQAEVLRAWQFETTHDADGDGIYDNAQGTGWVESWPPGMPKQEIYLALLDEQASQAMAELGGWMGDNALAAAARARAAVVDATMEREYFRPATGTYGFSWNNGQLDASATIYPALAWWSGGKGLEHSEASLRAWASHSFATDWGLRDVSVDDPLYDGMSYHQGSVWPLFTGWAAMAQYRAGNALAGYQAAMQNVDLTYAQDPGAVTELLSGDFFEPFGRSTSHQLWSSAMVVTPVLRGLFGIEVDGLKQEVRVAPHLPADWDTAEVDQLHVGTSVVDLRFKREAQSLMVSLVADGGTKVRLAGASGDGLTMRVPLPAVEVSFGHGLPLRGARTAQMKVLSETTDAHTLKLELEGVAGSSAVLHVRRNGAVHPKADGAELLGDELRVQFGAWSGYVRQAVTLRW